MDLQTAYFKINSIYKDEIVVSIFILIICVGLINGSKLVELFINPTVYKLSIIGAIIMPILIIGFYGIVFLSAIFYVVRNIILLLKIEKISNQFVRNKDLDNIDIHKEFNQKIIASLILLIILPVASITLAIVTLT